MQGQMHSKCKADASQTARQSKANSKVSGKVKVKDGRTVAQTACKKPIRKAYKRQVASQ
jgi:hypothetical protein